MKQSLILLVACLILMQEVRAAERKETYRKETKGDVAERILLDGERAIHRGDARGAKEARSASSKARYAKSVEQARQIEKVYNKDNFN
jgi:hypothetical protein